MFTVLNTFRGINMKTPLFLILCLFFSFVSSSNLDAKIFYNMREPCPGGYYGKLPHYAYPRWYHDYYYRCKAYPRWYHGPSLQYWKNYPRNPLPERLRDQWRDYQ